MVDFNQPYKQRTAKESNVAETKCVECLNDQDNLYWYKFGFDEKTDRELQAFALEQMGRRRRGEYTSGVPRIPVPSPSPEQWRNMK